MLGTEERYGFRVDYVKCAIPLHAEAAVPLKNRWYEVFQQEEATGHGTHSCNVVSVKSASDGRYLYVFEAWGEACMHVDELAFEAWAPYLNRIDIRMEQEVTDEGLDALYTHLQAYNPTRRNVNRMASRLRSKRGGRDSGGNSVSLGSHKSDFRFSAYKRGDNKGAVEYQISGEFLNKERKAFEFMYANGYIAGDENPWGALALRLKWTAEAEFRQASNLSATELQRTLSGKVDADGIIEGKLERLEEDISKLPDTARHGLLRYIQETLV